MTSSDRRRFTRVPFEADTELSIDGKQTWRCELIDLSLKGALLKSPESHSVNPGDEGVLKVFIDGSDIVLEMSAKVRHCDHDTIGTSCTPLDLESVAHLRRLIELNTGDSSLLDREVAIMHEANLEENRDERQ